MTADSYYSKSPPLMNDQFASLIKRMAAGVRLPLIYLFCFLTIIRYTTVADMAIRQEAIHDPMNIGDNGSVSDIPIKVAARMPNSAPTRLPVK